MDFDYTTETITPDSTDVLTIGGTGGIEISVGTTAQRPLVPVDGTLRYNTDLNAFEGYENGAWVLLVQTSTSTALSAITAALAPNSINNGDFAQTWNWSLTTASTSAFLFTENSPSTNGGGAQYLLDVGTIAASTANPIRVRAQDIDIFNVTSVGEVTLTGATASTGQPLTLSSGTSTGANTAGPPITIVAGDGLGSGVGGAINITAGSTVSGNGGGGAVGIAGGAGNGSGDGGAIGLTGGSVSGGNAVGGAVNITGGTGSGSGSGGAVVIVAGNSPGGNSTGAIASLTAGEGSGSGVGGTAAISAGNAAGTGAGGPVTIEAGHPANGDGGSISITSSAGVGTNMPGGSLTLTAGDRTGSGIAGSINLVIPATGTLEINGSAGTAGQVITSNGASLAPTWTTPTPGVTTFSAGTTGFTPSSATSGAITLAGTLIAANGGTGFASYAIGDLLFADTTTTLAKLADIATGNALISGGVGVAPSWGKIGLTTHVSGTLPIANGGTNSATALSGSSIMVSNGTSIIQGTAGTTTTVLHGNAAGTPTYGAVVLTTDVSGILPLANGGSNANLTAVNGGIVYSTATAMAITAAGTTGQVLTSNGAAAPTWVSTAGILQLYKENPSAPTAPTASGTNAVAIGNGATASATNSIAIGQGTAADSNNEIAIANGNFATAGDAQTMITMCRNTTTNTTPTQLFIDGSAQRMVLPNNTVWTFTIRVAGRRTDATGGYSSYTFVGVIRKNTTGGSTTLEASTRTIVFESTAALDCTIAADTTNSSLNITVTGLAGQTWRWVATSEITQVTN